MDEVSIRLKAMELYSNGISVTQICIKLGRSRKWFYKWKKRHDALPNKGWYLDQSKAPVNKPGKWSPELESHIIRFRKELASGKYNQIGAVSIIYKFYEQKMTPPNVWTINRVLKKNGLLTKKPSRVKSKHISYPGTKYLSVDQMDFVGPRYIKNFGRVYSLNVIDIETHIVGMYSLLTMKMDNVIQSLLHYWHEKGLPDYVQMDNALSFRGSIRYPRSFGKIIRFIFSLGVRVIFIPVSEPWRNGIIEKFNDTYDKKFYRQNEFVNLDDMKKKLKNFQNFIIRIIDTLPIIHGHQTNKEYI